MTVVLSTCLAVVAVVAVVAARRCCWKTARWNPTKQRRLEVPCMRCAVERWRSQVVRLPT